MQAGEPAIGIRLRIDLDRDPYHFRSSSEPMPDRPFPVLQRTPMSDICPRRERLLGLPVERIDFLGADVAKQEE